MNKNLNELLNKLAAEPALFEKFNEQQNLDALYSFSLSVVDGYSIEEFKDFLNKITDVCSEHQNNIQEISPNELEKVAGGLSQFDPKKLKSLILTGFLVAGGISGLETLSGGNSVYASPISATQSKTSITAAPTASTITYGQKLSASALSGGVANVPGSFDWVDPNIEPTTVGEHTYWIRFTPQNSNFSKKTLQIRVKVKKATPRIFRNPQAKSITYGEALYNSTLSNGSASVSGTFIWKNANNRPNAGFGQYVDVIFVPDDEVNYERVNLCVPIDVASAPAPSKSKPYIIVKPRAKSITYGEALYNSTLDNGSGNVSGSFIWKDANKYLDAGNSQYMDVIFIPNDEQNYERVSLRVPIDVKKAPSSIVSYPFASSITYGQPLRASNIYGLRMNVPGSIEWASADAKLSAGNHMCSIIFTPFSSNYESKNIEVNVTVDKATPTLDQNSFTQSYKPNMVVGNFRLPNGWRWQNPNIRLDSIGRFEVNAIHDETNNYRYRSETVFIEITKAEPQAPSYDIVYNPNGRLRDIHLPAGWHWVNENEIPINAKRSYKANFNAYEAGTPFYHSRDFVEVSVNVQKAVPKVSVWAKQCTDIVFGTDLTTVPIDGGASEVSGRFTLARPYEELRAGEHMCKVIFTPTDPNYSSVTGTIPIKISKNMTPLKAPEMPSAVRKDTSISFDISNFKSEVEFSKDNGKSWQSSPTFEGLSPSTPYHFNIRYKENDSRCAGHTSQAVQVLTKASSPSAPPAPVVKSRTRHKIVLESNDKLEFSIDNGGNWQSSPEFTDLKRKTEYTVISRLKETDDAMPSVQSEYTKVKTNRFPRPLSWIFG